MPNESQTLFESLAFRYPVVWAHGPDPIEIVSEVQLHCLAHKDLNFYLFDAIEGLKVWNRRHERFHSVIQIKDVADPVTGDTFQVHAPITDIPPALHHLLADSYATLVITDAEAFEDGLNGFTTFMSYNWRQGWQSDNLSRIPLQIVFASTVNPEPPEGMRSFAQVINFQLPTSNEIAQDVAHLCEHYGVSGVDIPAVSQAAVGLNRFDAIKTFHHHLNTTRTIDARKLEDDKFARLVATTPLDIKRPQVTLDDVAGFDNLKKILDTSNWIRNNPDQAKRLGAEIVPHRFLMLGPPGVGKSMIAEAMADYVDLSLIRTGLTHMASKWHGETEQNTRALFQWIEALTPVVVWIDEFGRDVSGGQSSHVVDGGTTSRSHGIFLTGMQELDSRNYLIAAANDISNLAPEMLRADRFDTIMFAGFPTVNQRYKIFEHHLAGRDHGVNISKVSAGAVSFTGAEIKSAIALATSYAISERRAVNTEDVMTAMQNDKNRIWLRHRDYMQNMYRRALDEFAWASDDQRAEASSYANGKLPSNSETRKSFSISGSVV